MALSINDPETDRLARGLAKATGESITVAIRVALAERLQRLRRIKLGQANPAELEEIILRGRDRAMLGSGPRDEGVGYDEHGLPR